MDYAYELQDEAFFLGKYEPMLIRRKPSEYLKMMYLIQPAIMRRRSNAR